jgi:hypothetical protein
MSQGAVARRNRTLKIYGIILVAGAVSLIVYCATRPDFDLTTPKLTLATFKRAMDDRRWSVAEKCLTNKCREYYGEAIRDRSLFNFYSPHGYQVDGNYKFVPHWKVGEIVVKEDKGTARAKIVSKVFVIGGNQAAFWLSLKKCEDDLWRVDGPQVNFKHYYDRYIPSEARSWARDAERK